MRPARPIPFSAIFAAALAAAMGTGCSATPSSTSTVTTTGPSFPEFVGTDNFAPGVHTFLENQCGTLDCHGQIGRPFRLYSLDGLRIPNDAGLIAGAGADTAQELVSNYESAVNLEPEAMARVVAGGDPMQLLLVKKPMGLERHKGGTRIVSQGDPQYTCLIGWLMGGENNYSTQACSDAANLR